jgi:predicted AlkP superfamily phosphohydrolase/phosphomutase
VKHRLTQARLWKAALAGLAAGALGSAAILLAILTRNPWFLDQPSTALAIFSMPLSVAGAAVAVCVARLAGRIPAGLSAVVLVGGLSAVPLLGLLPPPGPVTGLKLLVFGLDGASWKVIDALGSRLPTLERLQREGVRADLRSMEPMFSPLLWTTIDTGKPPEQHGIHGFHTANTDVKVARFWEIMERRGGLKLGVYKWLVSYPPEQLSGFMVPAWLAPGPETWPSELSFIKEIELSRRSRRQRVEARHADAVLLWQGVCHGIRTSTVRQALVHAFSERFLRPSEERSAAGAQFLRARMDADVFVWALHRYQPDVATFCNYEVDALGHLFWKYYEPSSFPGITSAQVARWGSVLPDAYRQADAILRRILMSAGPETRLVMVSDHGFRAEDASDQGRFFFPTTRRLQERLIQAAGPLEVGRLGRKLVVSLPSSTDDIEASKSAIETFLQDVLVDGATGEPFFRWEPIPGSDFSLGLTLRDEDVTPARLENGTVGGEPMRSFVTRAESSSGEHDWQGVFLARGPGVETGRRLEELSLLDVAPTLLALVGIPKAEDMTGHVPDGLWEQAPVLPPGPSTYDDIVRERKIGTGIAGVNEEQLRVLGYVE